MSNMINKYVAVGMLLAASLPVYGAVGADEKMELRENLTVRIEKYDKSVSHVSEKIHQQHEDIRTLEKHRKDFTTKSDRKAVRTLIWVKKRHARELEHTKHALHQAKKRLEKELESLKK